MAKVLLARGDSFQLGDDGTPNRKDINDNDDGDWHGRPGTHGQQRWGMRRVPDLVFEMPDSVLRRAVAGAPIALLQNWADGL
jgi:hypothetical protein